MKVNESIAYTRPLLSTALLFCVLVVTACESESCGFMDDLVAPSEVSSDAPQGAISLAVKVTYDIAGGSSPAATVRVSGAGSVVLDATNRYDFLAVPDISKGDTVVFNISSSAGSLAIACTYGGKVGLLHDVTVVVRDPGLDPNGRRPPPVASCVGW